MFEAEDRALILGLQRHRFELLDEASRRRRIGEIALSF